MKSRLLLILSLFFSVVCKGQETNSTTSSSDDTQREAGYNDFLPPSPTAYELGKYGQVPVSLATGTPNINIPLHTLATGNLSLPVSLSYNSNGVKVDQVASWVGLGWSLNAGGVVTRVIRDMPDEDNQWPYPEEISDMSLESLTYIKKAVLEGGFDSEQDEYSFNFMGYTGKVVFDRQGQPRFSPHQSLKIDRRRSGLADFDEIVITTPDGVNYFFGGLTAKEKTMRVTGSCGKNYMEGRAVVTAWYLAKVVHPAGDEIALEYIPYTYRYQTGINQTVTRTLTTYSGCTSSTTTYCPEKNDVATCLASVSMNGVRLNKITTRNHGEIIFSSSTGRADILGEFKLDSLTILRPTGHPLKKFAFSYKYSTNPRMFLDGVVEKDNAHRKGKIYSFEYEDFNALPARLSYAQDHWGYYNGALNNKYLVPNNATGNSIHFENIGGDREPNSTYSGKGMLNKIVYPTGGSTEFSYGPNTFYGNRLVYPASSEFRMNIPAYREVSRVTETQELQIYNKKLTLRFRVDGSHEGDVGHRNLEYAGFSITQKSTGKVVLSNVVTAGKQVVEEISFKDIYGDKTFILEMFAEGKMTTADAHFLYYATNPYGEMANLETGGVRINEVRDKEPESGKVQVTKYHYGALESLDQSSGELGYQPMYYSEYGIKISCGSVHVDNVSIEGCYEGLCMRGALHSNSQNSLFNTSGQNIAYRHVTVSKGENFENGGEEHSFRVHHDVENRSVYGDYINDVPLTNLGWENGLLDSVRVFKIGLSGHPVILRKTVNSYKKDERREFSVAGLIARYRYGSNCQANKTFICTGQNYFVKNLVCTAEHDHQLTTSSSWACRAPGYNIEEVTLWASPCNDYPAGDTLTYHHDLYEWDVAEYRNMSYWHYLNATRETMYDENGNNPIQSGIDYYYDNASHLQLTRTVTTTSAGEIEETIIAYPDEYLNVPTMQALKEKHILAVPVKTEKVVNGKQIMGQVFNYNSVGLVTEVYDYETETLKPAETHDPGQLVPSADYKPKTTLAYNRKNLIKEVTGADGIKHSYIWGYDNSQLVAHILNAGQDQVAYSGFEKAGLGNWVVEKSKSVALTSVNRVTTIKTYRSQSVSFSSTMTVTNGAALEFRFTETDGTVVSATVSYSPGSGSLQLPAGEWTVQILHSKDIANATLSFTAYLNEEADLVKGNEGKTGSSSLELSQAGYILKKNLSAGSYQVTFWQKSGVVSVKVNGQEAVKDILDADTDGWQLVRVKWTVATPMDEIAISGTGLLDELRLNPEQAQVTTYTYDQGVGLSSVADHNGKVVYYSYDSFGRLEAVKDDTGNVLKSYQYNYKGL